LRVVKRAVQVGLCLLLVGLTLEVCARVDDHLTDGAPWVGLHSFDDMVTFDGSVLRGRPGVRFDKWRMNNLGFRGRDRALAKPPGTLRVVALGASETFGVYESSDMEYPAQLERMLAARLRRRVEVFNTAFLGMSLPRVTEFCRRDLGSLHADVVVYYPTPTSYLSDRPPGSAVRPRASAPALELRVARYVEKAVRSHVPEDVLYWIRRVELDRLISGKPPSWFFHEAPADRLELFETHLEELIACVRRSGARLILVTHPHRFGGGELTPTDRRLFVAWRRFYPRATDRGLLSMEESANASIRKLADRNGVEVADLARAVPPHPENFADYAHFTDRGATIAAGALADVIARSR
jgi:hypothetical protein